MSWRTNATVIRLRTILRRTGLTRLLGVVTAGRTYEDRFRAPMLDLVRTGDCIWDIGANVGLYSREFIGRVGAQGAVVCFEPSQTNVARLAANVARHSNVLIFDVALGAEEGSLRFQQGEDLLGATSKVLQGGDESSGAGLERVTVVRGDHLVADGKAPLPNVIKIDTEGFELEVLRGLSKTLQFERLRAVCVEVHFGLLAERGIPEAPAEIESLLQAAGFRCRWTDSSHIIAQKP